MGFKGFMENQNSENNLSVNSGLYKHVNLSGPLKAKKS